MVVCRFAPKAQNRHCGRRHIRDHARFALLVLHSVFENRHAVTGSGDRASNVDLAIRDRVRLVSRQASSGPDPDPEIGEPKTRGRIGYADAFFYNGDGSAGQARQAFGFR